MLDILFVNGRVYINGRFLRVNVGVTGEKISYIGKEKPKAKKIINVQNNRMIPGLIDPHVHFELFCGTITSRDDFYYGSKTASYGGVTTFVDFLDPSRNAKELEETFNQRLALAKKSNVDYHFHACIKEPNGDLEAYVLKMKELGMNTIKLFTTYSETHRRTYDEDIIKLLKLSRKYNFIVCAHIENDEMIKHDPKLTYRDLPVARSSEAETSEALKLCEFAAKTKGHLYMVHCSSGRTLELIVKNYEQYLGKNIFIESCPQYFVFNNEVLKQKNGYLYTFAPPLRSEEERKLMFKYFDYISCIGTDHCSFTIADKKSHQLLKGMPLGIGGIETSFLIMYEFFGNKVIDKMCKNVANIQRFKGKNGIKVGNYADFAFMSDTSKIIGRPHGKADYSVYQRLLVKHSIISTMSRGKFVMRNKKFYPNRGHLVNCEEVEL